MCAMSKRELLLAIIVGVVGNLVTWIFFQPPLRWLKNKTIALLLSTSTPSANHLDLHYRRVGAKDTSPIRLLISGFVTVLWIPLLLRDMDRFNAALSGAAYGYFLLSFTREALAIYDVNSRVVIYQAAVTAVRPYVSDSALSQIDADFVRIRSEKDYDKIMERLVALPKTNPRT
jgi:hypothetical protein